MSMMQVENTFFDLAEACTDRNVLGTIPVLTFAKFLDVLSFSANGLLETPKHYKCHM